MFCKLHNTITAYRVSKMMMMDMQVVDHFCNWGTKIEMFLEGQNIFSAPSKPLRRGGRLRTVIMFVTGLAIRSGSTKLSASQSRRIM